MKYINIVPISCTHHSFSDKILTWCSRWRGTPWVSCARRRGRSTARWRSSGCRCRAGTPPAAAPPARSAPCRTAAGARTSTHPRPGSRAPTGCAPRLSNHSLYPLQLSVTNIVPWGSFLMVCWMYCCTAKVESISSNDSSGHLLKLHVFVPGKFLLTIVLPPSAILVIIFCLQLNIFEFFNVSLKYKTAPTFVSYINT